jgi:hypothetical protein
MKSDSSVRAEASRLLLHEIDYVVCDECGDTMDLTGLVGDPKRPQEVFEFCQCDHQLTVYMKPDEYAQSRIRALLAEEPELCLCGTDPAENACMKLASDGKLADGYRCRRELTRPDPETITQLQQFIIEMHGAAAGCPPQGSLRALITSWRDGLSDLLAGLAASQENGK